MVLNLSAIVPVSQYELKIINIVCHLNMSTAKLVS